MIAGSSEAIEFYIKSAWARGKSTSEIIKKVYDTFGKSDDINKITLSCIAYLHASTVYRQEEY